MYWPFMAILASQDTIGQIGQKWPVYRVFTSQASIGQFWNDWPVKPVLASHVWEFSLASQASWDSIGQSG